MSRLRSLCGLSPWSETKKNALLPETKAVHAKRKLPTRDLSERDRWCVGIILVSIVLMFLAVIFIFRAGFLAGRDLHRGKARDDDENANGTAVERSLADGAGGVFVDDDNDNDNERGLVQLRSRQVTGENDTDVSIVPIVYTHPTKEVVLFGSLAGGVIVILFCVCICIGISTRKQRRKKMNSGSDVGKKGKKNRATRSCGRASSGRGGSVSVAGDSVAGGGGGSGMDTDMELGMSDSDMEVGLTSVVGSEMRPPPFGDMFYDPVQPHVARESGIIN